MPKDKVSRKRKNAASSPDAAADAKPHKKQGSVSERSHLENQERAYIAASRRKDRPIEARLESAYKASDCHKRIHGRGLWITREIVENDLFYDEHDPRFERMKNGAGMRSNSFSTSQSQPYTSVLLDSLHMHHIQAKDRPSPQPMGWNAYASSIAGRSPTLQHNQSRNFSMSSMSSDGPAMYKPHMQQPMASPAPSNASLSINQAQGSTNKSSSELFNMIQQAQGQRRRSQIMQDQMHSPQLEHYPTQWNMNNFTGVMFPTYTQNMMDDFASPTHKKDKLDDGSIDPSLADASRQDITRNFKLDIEAANTLGRVPEIKTPDGMPSMTPRWNPTETNNPHFFISPMASQANVTHSVGLDTKYNDHKPYDLFRGYQGMDDGEQHTNDAFDTQATSTPHKVHTPMDEAATMFPMGGDTWEWMVNFPEGSQESYAPANFG